MILKVYQTRNHRDHKLILQNITTEVLKLSPTSNFKRNVSELVTSSNNNKYSREEECRNSGVIIDRKVFIGHYTGNKWNDGSIKPYHEEIHKVRQGNPNSRNYGRGKIQSSN